MNSGSGPTAGDEWRHHWMIAVGAAIGFSTFGLHAFAFGPFVAPIEKTFGWSRTEVMLGLTISNGVAIFLNFGIGLLIDRLGPRFLGLTGILIKCSAFALISTATGTLFNWSLLWALSSVGAVMVQAIVWTSGVSHYFDKARGLAIAVALTGSSITATISPIFSAWLMQQGHDWRFAIAVTGLTWLVVILPFVFLLYRAKPRGGNQVNSQITAAEPQPAAIAGVTLREGLRMGVFWRIVIANCSFIFYTSAMAPNLIPMLGERGATPVLAAQIASLAGIAGFIGRISGGLLLDRFPSRVISTIIFLVPIAGAAMMLANGGFWLLALSVFCFGITMGAEYDVVIYLASRHFGMKAFGALMGTMMTVGAAAASLGPITAGMLHDRSGNYATMLFIFMGLMALNAVGMATMPRPARNWTSDS